MGSSGASASLTSSSEGSSTSSASASSSAGVASRSGSSSLDGPSTPPSTRRPTYPVRGGRKVTDERGDYIFCEGELIADRYEVRRSGPLGSGAFGIVVEAFDIHKNKLVALKLIKARPKFAQQAESEAQLLRRISSHGDFDSSRIVVWLDHFKWGSHECLVFERLSQSLYQVLALSQFQGVSLNLVRKFAGQLLKSLDFLRHRDVDVIHCDLKPENVLLAEPSSQGQVKIIDFGSSCMTHNQLHKYIQSRWYRAPEVLLGIPYGQEVDIWSVACILSELHTGRPLFPGGHEPLTKRSASHDMLCRFSRVIGELPQHMLDEAVEVAHQNKANKAAGKKDKRLTGVDMSDETFHWELSNLATHRSPKSELAKVHGADTWGPRGKWARERHHSSAHYDLFLDFMEKMLRFDPKRRALPSELLQHPFLDDDVWHGLGTRPTETSL